MSSSCRHVIRLLSNGRTIDVVNSLGGKREALSTATDGVMKWYSCGPTVYDDAHLGHGRAYVSFDIIRRLLQTRTGINIEYALGMTDVDDKIINRAKEKQQDALKLARFYEQRFFHDMSALNVLYPTHVLRVTEHVDDIQALIERLESSGMAYVPEDSNSVYFSVQSRGSRYAQLDPSRNMSTVGDGDRNISGEGESSEKQDQRDFALWKSKQPEEEGEDVNWDSKWGKGRPGWHIECSAMAIRTLGDHLDLHTGGIDLRFPHHTNELATAEAFLDLPGHCCEGHCCDRWSHTWLHAGHLHISGLKMSKSLKNFITIRSFLQDRDADTDDAGDERISGCASVFRLFCLANRYSSPVELNYDRIVEARAILKRINTFIGRDISTYFYDKPSAPTSTMSMKATHCPVAANIYAALYALDNDIDTAVGNNFDTPSLLRSILKCMDTANTTFRSSESSNPNQPVSFQALMAFEEARQRLMVIFDQLGFDFQSSSVSSSAQLKDVIHTLVNFRHGVRSAAKQKDISAIFQLCDKLRDTARQELGINIMDSKNSSSWTET